MNQLAYPKILYLDENVNKPMHFLACRRYKLFIEAIRRDIFEALSRFIYTDQVDLTKTGSIKITVLKSKVEDESNKKGRNKVLWRK